MPFNEQEIEIHPVLEENDIDELFTIVDTVPIEMSPFLRGCDLDKIKKTCYEPDVLFLSVYYENVLTGYIIIKYKTPQTVEFHWGVIKKNKYLPKIIESCFKLCRVELSISNFIGTIPVDNQLSLKIALKLGFTKLATINNYTGGGLAVYLVLYGGE